MGFSESTYHLWATGNQNDYHGVKLISYELPGTRMVLTESGLYPVSYRARSKVDILWTTWNQNGSHGVKFISCELPGTRLVSRSQVYILWATGNQNDYYGVFHLCTQPQFGHVISTLLHFAHVHPEIKRKGFKSAPYMRRKWEQATERDVQKGVWGVCVWGGGGGGWREGEALENTFT